MRLVLISLVSLVMVACDSSKHAEEVVTDQPGGETSENWRMVIQLPGQELPVQMHLASDNSEAWFINGIERVHVPEIEADGDRLTLRFPHFNNSFELTRSGDEMHGELTLVKLGYEQVMPVSARRGVTYRYSESPVSDVNVTGLWETVFTDEEGKKLQAVGVLDQQGSRVTGTFLTPKGDYRYLEGEVSGRKLLLSTFDGAHAFTFTADIDAEGRMAGDFLSGTKSHETWQAFRNFDAKLEDPYQLTYLKEGYKTLEFTFPNLDGEPVSLSDSRFKGKVVLVTLSGTWCPNCADEVDFLSAYFDRNRDRGLEVVTLLYEHFEDFERAAQQAKALKDEFQINFELLIAGISDKTAAAETLPMLNHVLAFPTMIFIGRDGVVKRIHTGFNGPGTGEYYEQFVADFKQQMDELLAEDAG
jgi:peroxiredoxin